MQTLGRLVRLAVGWLVRRMAVRLGVNEFVRLNQLWRDSRGGPFSPSCTPASSRTGSAAFSCTQRTHRCTHRNQRTASGSAWPPPGKHVQVVFNQRRKPRLRLASCRLPGLSNRQTRRETRRCASRRLVRTIWVASTAARLARPGASKPGNSSGNRRRMPVQLVRQHASGPAESKIPAGSAGWLLWNGCRRQAPLTAPT